MASNINGFEALASAVRTATTNSSDISVPTKGRGVMVTINFTVQAGAETVQLLLQAKDTATGAYQTIAKTAALSAPGVASLLVKEGLAVATLDALTFANCPVPGTLRVRVVHSAAGSHTYGVGYQYI